MRKYTVFSYPFPLMLIYDIEASSLNLFNIYIYNTKDIKSQKISSCIL
ncbi:hypothetical protein HMPREF1551_02097 [Capnocytophaga sp. oral taxon 863 str. F0517]|nr:hypothetical protein HMPREF1551_02097 [Capnocytophaga sp. oral taxon 863 str. F0517]